MAKKIEDMSLGQLLAGIKHYADTFGFPKLASANNMKFAIELVKEGDFETLKIIDTNLDGEDLTCWLETNKRLRKYR